MSDAAQSQPTRRVLRTMTVVIAWLLLWAGLTLLIASAGIIVFYGRISLDQLLLNLIAVQTDGGGGAGLVWAAIIVIGVVPIALTLSLALWRRRRIRTSTRTGRRSLAPGGDNPRHNRFRPCPGRHCGRCFRICTDDQDS